LPSKDQTVVHSITNASHIGPSVLLRFYCRGDYDLDSVNESLKAAVNEALLLVYSNYITSIDNEVYMNSLQFNRCAPQYRHLHQDTYELKLNNEARYLKFGKTIKNMSLADLNSFLIDSLNINQIDLKVHQETIEHLYEYIPTSDNKSYDFYRVFDCIFNGNSKKKRMLIGNNFHANPLIPDGISYANQSKEIVFYSL
jgi:hypothetical protein